MFTLLVFISTLLFYNSLLCLFVFVYVCARVFPLRSQRVTLFLYEHIFFFCFRWFIERCGVSGICCCWSYVKWTDQVARRINSQSQQTLWFAAVCVDRFFFSFVAISTEKFYSSQSIKQLKKCIRINLSSIMIIWRVSEKRKRRFLSCLELSQSQTSFLLFNLCGAARMYYNRWDN